MKVVHQLAIKQMEYCCGIPLIYSLTKFEDPISTDPIPRNWLDAHGKSAKAVIEAHNKNSYQETRQEYKDRIRESLKKVLPSWLGKKSYFLCALNKIEYDLIDDVMLECGFEVLVDECRNPTGSHIKLYIYHLLPQDERPKVKPFFKRK